MSTQSNMDSRGVLRGKCCQCECTEYKKTAVSHGKINFSKFQRTDCLTCSHKPMVHIDLSNPSTTTPNNRSLPSAYILDQGLDYCKFKTKVAEEKCAELEKKMHQAGYPKTISLLKK